MRELSEILEELSSNSTSERVPFKEVVVLIAEAYEAGMQKASLLINNSIEEE